MELVKGDPAAGLESQADCKLALFTGMPEASMMYF